MLVLSRRKNESIVIGDNIEVHIVEIRGDQVRLGIEADKEIPIHRREVFDKIRADQRQSPAQSRMLWTVPQPREFEPDPRPTGDAEHFLREGLEALRLASGYRAGSKGESFNLCFAHDKFRKCLAILAARTSPVVDPGG